MPAFGNMWGLSQAVMVAGGSAQHLEPEAGMLKVLLCVQYAVPVPNRPTSTRVLLKIGCRSSQPSKHSIDLFDGESRKSREEGHGRTEEFI